MTKPNILYISADNRFFNKLNNPLDEFVLKCLCGQYTIHLYNESLGDKTSLAKRKWDLVIVKDTSSYVVYKRLFKNKSGFPLLFISTKENMKGYIASFHNLFGILNIGNASHSIFSIFGIPQEMQIKVNWPVEQTRNFYQYEDKPEKLHLAYCTTRSCIPENDLKVLSVLEGRNVKLTLISDLHENFRNAFPPFVRIQPRSSLLTTIKKAHLVIASGQDAVQAMAFSKPCIILGDYGLGGMVTTDNYDILESCSFNGRNGGSFKEYIPADLLLAEIQKALSFDYSKEQKLICKKIKATYNLSDFNKTLSHEVERIIQLYHIMKNRKKRLLLKPLLTSAFKITESEGKKMITRGMICFGEIDHEMLSVLKRCDGKTSILEILQNNGIEKDDAPVLWDNLMELWKEKMILFKI